MGLPDAINIALLWSGERRTSCPNDLKMINKREMLCYWLPRKQSFSVSPLPIQRIAMSIAHDKHKRPRSSGAQCTYFILKLA